MELRGGRSAAPEPPLFGIWLACTRFQTFAEKEAETRADRARSELGVFSSCLADFPPVSQDPPTASLALEPNHELGADKIA